MLRQEITNLQLELMEYKQGTGIMHPTITYDIMDPNI